MNQIKPKFSILAKWREKAGLSRRALAKLVGRSEMQIYRIEIGEIRASNHIVQKLIDVLKEQATPDEIQLAVGHLPEWVASIGRWDPEVIVSALHQYKDSQD